MPTQIAQGIHFRQYSQAFIIADARKKSRVVFVNADICMGSHADYENAGMYLFSTRYLRYIIIVDLVRRHATVTFAPLDLLC